jgi:hypothetical protein
MIGAKYAGQYNTVSPSDGDVETVCPLWDLKRTKRTITLHSLKIMESFDNRFTTQVDFNYL